MKFYEKPSLDVIEIEAKTVVITDSYNGADLDPNEEGGTE